MIQMEPHLYSPEGIMINTGLIMQLYRDAGKTIEKSYVRTFAAGDASIEQLLEMHPDILEFIDNHVTENNELTEIERQPFRGILKQVQLYLKTAFSYVSEKKGNAWVEEFFSQSRERGEPPTISGFAHISISPTEYLENLSPEKRNQLKKDLIQSVNTAYDMLKSSVDTSSQ